MNVRGRKLLHQMRVHWQLYLLLLLSRVILLFTVDAEMMGGKNLLSLTLSAVFSMLLTFMLAAPALYAHRRWPQKNLLAIGEMAFGKMGRDLLAVLYLLFFLVADGYYLCDFGRFLQVETEYGASVWLIRATVVLATLYCLKKGLQAIARTAVLAALTRAARMVCPRRSSCCPATRLASRPATAPTSR